VCKQTVSMLQLVSVTVPNCLHWYLWLRTHGLANTSNTRHMWRMHTILPNVCLLHTLAWSTNTSGTAWCPISHLKTAENRPC
jgi:hypothetical protein